eukprot:m.144390 g.144390  ORF g.144390 m.144390 type:complete len:78 (-) comp17192_c0_seq4:142-375(-)
MPNTRVVLRVTFIGCEIQHWRDPVTFTKINYVVCGSHPLLASERSGDGDDKDTGQDGGGCNHARPHTQATPTATTTE